MKFALLFFIVSLYGCSSDIGVSSNSIDNSIEVSYRTTQLDSLNKISNMSSITPKYVFLFIGDGMGVNHVNITKRALEVDPLLSTTSKTLIFPEFPVNGLMTNDAVYSEVTGSAASATSMATGYKTAKTRVGVDADNTKSFKNISEMFKEQGRKVGIITSVGIDNATPAGFYAHQDSRYNEYAIALQLPTSGIDYFAGGRSRGNKRRPEGADDVELMAEDSGYVLVKDRAMLSNMPKGEKVWAFDNSSTSTTLPYEIDNKTNRISLLEFTKEGIPFLENSKGFFMMVEGGKIDLASHVNDFGTAVNEIIGFNDAVELAYEFYKEKPDSTLIIVTSDHETGGLNIENSAMNLELIKYQIASNDELTKELGLLKEKNASFQQVLAKISYLTGLGDGKKSEKLLLSAEDSLIFFQGYNAAFKGLYSEKVGTESNDISYGSQDPLLYTVLYVIAEKIGIKWETFNHTADPIAVYAVGRGSGEFDGFYDNTDIAKKIIKICGLEEYSDFK